MIIEADKTFLMLKITTPENISFYDEHIKIIEKNGYVWFGRFGKSNVLLDSVCRDGKILFVRESIKNGNKKFIMSFSEIKSEKPDFGYPRYYDTMYKNASLWFKVNSISELPPDFERHFRIAKSNNTLENVYRSMCSAFYIKSIEKVEF